jgi:polar amino acid transport system substrate-binding protein
MLKSWKTNFFTTFLLVILLLGCSAKNESYTPYGLAYDNQKVLRVGLSADYPPLVFKEEGKLYGIEVDMAKKLAYELKVKIIFVELPREKLISALVNKKIDIIMSGMSITAQRQQQVNFIQPYMQVGQMALIRKSSLAQFSNRSSVLNTRMRVAYQPDTTSESFVKTSMLNAKLVPEKSVESAVAALRNDKVDIFIHDAPTIWLIAGNVTEQQLMGLYWPLTEEYLAWAVRPSSILLQEALNNVVVKWRENGTLRSILNSWIKLQIEVSG